MTWLAGRGGRRHAEMMAREERRQQRFADAYIELLTTVEKMGQWAQLVRPMLDIGITVPPLPDLDQQARVQALVAGHASGEVQNLFEKYTLTVREILKVDRQIGLVIEHGDKEIGVSRVDLWEHLDMTLRLNETAARKALAQQVPTSPGVPNSHLRFIVDVLPSTRPYVATRATQNQPGGNKPTLAVLSVGGLHRLVEAILATLTDPTVVEALAGLTGVDPLAVPQPAGLDLHSGPTVTELLDMRGLEPVPDAGASCGANLLAQPAWTSATRPNVIDRSTTGLPNSPWTQASPAWKTCSICITVWNRSRWPTSSSSNACNLWIGW
jgi:hypothetical protein